MCICIIVCTLLFQIKRAFLPMTELPSFSTLKGTSREKQCIVRSSSPLRLLHVTLTNVRMCSALLVIDAKAPFGLPHIHLVRLFFFQPESCFSLTTFQSEQYFSANFSQDSASRTEYMLLVQTETHETQNQA